MNSNTLDNALEKQRDAVSTFRAKVLEIGDLESYKNKDKKMTYFNAVVGHKSTKATLRIYMLQLKNNLKQGASYLITNALRKSGEAHFWLPRGASFERCGPIEVANDAIFPGNNNAQDNQLRTLEEALTSPVTSTIQGKVCQISPIKLRRDGSMKLRFISLIDGPNQTACKVALFNKDTENPPAAGDIVQMTHVYGWKKRLTLNDNEPPQATSLGTKPTSEIEIVQSATISDFTPTHLCNDNDFEDIPDEEPPENFTLLSIQSTHVYNACPKIGCRNKKVTDNLKCPTCCDIITPVRWGNATISLLINDKVETFTVWRPDLLLMFTSLSADIFTPLLTSTQLEDLLAQEMANDINGKISYQKLDKGNHIIRITTKRQQDED